MKALTFDRDHTHAGEPVPRGAKREFDDSTAAWLIAQNVAHLTPSPARADKARSEQPTGERNHVE